MLVNVTQDCINYGVTGEGHQCPVAIAIRAYSEAVEAFVDHALITITDRGSNGDWVDLYFSTDPTLLQKISDYDNFGVMIPMQIELIAGKAKFVKYLD